ncbi:DUF1127 domain-containing protein [Chthonobacter rhizosphaerae]|uniref:DUF1127 domain-containing protein n=1 Tax=Chthonobacter rhizosphaerae TaxID=2735553 RepID=UPI0015EF692A|nr:DUF1127 domain-containing protein [Chthonobacter rhizosphaerae]
MITSKTATSRPVPSGAATIAAVLRVVFRGFADAWTVMQNRRRLKGIAELDDYLLADIGLTRDDLRTAYALPVHRDPTEYLADLSTERRTRGIRLLDRAEPLGPGLRCAATGKPLLRLVADDRRRSE